MRKIPLIIPFFLALFAQLYGSIFLPSFRFLAFAPFFAIAFQRLTLYQSLWTAVFIGLLIDLISPSLRFGFFSLNYFLTSWIAYRQKSLFFEDKTISFFFYTAFISCIASTLQLTLLLSSSSRFPIHLSFLFSDLLIMPLIDGVYAFFWFTCPLRVYTLIRKKWRIF